MTWSKLLCGAAVCGGVTLFLNYLHKKRDFTRITPLAAAGGATVAVVVPAAGLEEVQKRLGGAHLKRWTLGGKDVELHATVGEPTTLADGKVSIRVTLPAEDAMQIARLDNEARWLNEGDVPHPFADTHGKVSPADHVDMLCCILDKCTEGVEDVELVPIHQPALCRDILKDSQKKVNFLGATSARDGIAQYYGGATAYYFAFMDHYNANLVLPALAGLGTWLYGRRTGVSTAENPLVPVYSVLTTCWGVYTVARWEQRSHHLAVRWGMTGARDQERVRKEYDGTWRVPRALQQYLRDSPGELAACKESKEFPGWVRTLRSVVSWGCQGTLLAGVLGWMVVSLNLQGYMPQGDILRIEVLARQAEEGGWLDPAGYLSMVYPIVHSTCTNYINGWYRNVAELLATWENWRTEDEWTRSVTRKRLAFEICDTFFAQVYLAMVQKNLAAVASELHSCFQTDCLRRVVTESLVPFLMQKWRKRSSAVREEDLEPLEIFDEYLEMTMQFLYVTLWSSCFPLAPAIALVSNLVEVRSDAFKLAGLVRRPRPDPECDTEPWTGLLKVSCYASIFTNTFVLDHTSKHVRTLFPQIKEGLEVWLIFAAAWVTARFVARADGDDDIVLRYRRQERLRARQ
eukprot:TRINITY_DN32331_c0_g1_i1.p1 TRINITY_DN32331_c0_g1~~TRINITY_DN32331_c0_g1_i1.p1  ORF type:complete len:630 (+),score=185.96 TRINITY_DN32331_c0_g1_i1:66-1955(+)